MIPALVGITVVAGADDGRGRRVERNDEERTLPTFTLI